MSTGLFALLDDISALAKVAAATIDDATGQAARASLKAAGVVVDDTAVTPRYVVGFAAHRELPIIGKIAMGSLVNKLFILLPAALLLSAFAPWLIMPLLMLGGAFLCYEGAHKVVEAFHPHAETDQATLSADSAEEAQRREKAQVSGAIRTDFILSAEIMAITLGTVAAETQSILNQAVVLGIVALAITIGVYGIVAVIVKADDFGVLLANMKQSLIQAIGRGIVKGMPYLLKVLGVVGTAAMLWVGGGIVVHGLETFGFDRIGHTIHDTAHMIGHGIGAVEWTVSAAMSGVFGILLGAAILLALSGVTGAIKAVKAS